MALLETLMIELGTSIAKSILKMWSKDLGIVSDTSSSVVDVLKTWTTDRTTQRRAQRQLEEIGEKVGENLLPIFERDGANLDDGSRTAIALAVADTLNTVSAKVLAHFDLAPTELARYLWDHPVSTQHFNETEIALFRRIISESCEYIVDIASQLPAFSELTFAEILKREHSLLELAKQTLDEIRQMREQADPLLETQQFELEYRRAVVRKLDFLELFGVDLPPASRRHRLSTAYISLSIEERAPVDTHAMSIIPNTISKDLHQQKKEENRSVVSVETTLAGSRRLFIRGVAGSGKTTLLQWIAVNSAMQSFQEPLTAWNKTLPFYISLRYCMEGGLPGPEGFPKFISRALADTMPKGWVHTALQLGHAIILVDGLDEVPELQREDVRVWLKDLVESYPKAFFLVTSRPGAIGEDWIDWISREGFSEPELQPMNVRDIRTFIAHWHKAVLDELSEEEEKNKLPTLANHLKEEIEGNRSLHNLATSPLLCALLCALHRERQEQLPPDRIKLYEVCCEMLIERRDSARRISLADYPAAVLSIREKLVLLEDLAYWMINNGWSEIEVQRAEERFAKKLINMHNIPQNLSSTEIRRLFVERTNLIREPVVDHIDFTHRTFQEFLAAKAALDEGDIGVLVKNAHDDQWREVIILAAGLATRKVREELILELISRGDQEKRYHYQLHLLAVSCLDNSIELGQNVKTEVTKRLSTLIPPKNMSEARALAAGGELAVPYLAKGKQYQASITAACVRTLALIGGDTALKALESYIDDTRSTVMNELVRAWDVFDKETYVQRILAKLWLDVYKAQATPSLLDALKYLPKLTTLELWGCQQLSDLSPLANLTRLSSLVLGDCKQLSDLSPLANLTQLFLLELRDCPQLSDLSPLANLTQLSTLDLRDCPQQFIGLEILHELKGLKITG